MLMNVRGKEEDINMQTMSDEKRMEIKKKYREARMKMKGDVFKVFVATLFIYLCFLCVVK